MMMILQDLEGGIEVNPYDFINWNIIYFSINVFAFLSFCFHL